MFQNARVHIFGAVTVSVEPFFMVSGGVSEIPALQGGVEPESYFYYGLFNKTHAHGRGIPPGIICAYWTEHWHFFWLIQVYEYDTFIIYPSGSMIPTGACYYGS